MNFFRTFCGIVANIFYFSLVCAVLACPLMGAMVSSVIAFDLSEDWVGEERVGLGLLIFISHNALWILIGYKFGVHR